MRISQLIDELRAMQDLHGDVRTAVTVITDYGEDEERYFVGGLKFVPAKDERGWGCRKVTHHAAHVLIMDGAWDVTEEEKICAVESGAPK